MIEIYPSILSAPILRLVNVLHALKECGVTTIHLDVMDGSFVPPITYGADLAAAIISEVGLQVEAHLMVNDPEKHFSSFINAGCKSIIFHYEATPHPHRLLSKLKDLGVQSGIAFNPGTVVESIKYLAGNIDLILIMTVNPGTGGQKLIEETLPKVLRAKELSNANSIIEVDGGINKETLRKALTLGANRFVVGSYLYQYGLLKVAISEQLSNLNT
jgi:ribulose-phosphate 3-epimerase